MKPYFYTLLTAGGLLLLAPSPAQAARHSFTETPAEAQRKVVAREKVATEKKALKMSRTSSHKSKNAMTRLNHSMLVLLGLEASKRVVSPLKRDLQLHRHQQQLKARARQESKAHRTRCIRQMK